MTTIDRRKEWESKGGPRLAREYQLYRDYEWFMEKNNLREQEYFYIPMRYPWETIIDYWYAEQIKLEV